MERTTHSDHLIAKLTHSEAPKGPRKDTPALQHWDCSLGCLNPFTLYHKGYPDKDRPRERPGRSDPTVIIEQLLPCRKCETCLRNRRVYWAACAKTEVGCARRTWFGTLTLKPQERFIDITKVRIRHPKLEEENPREFQRKVHLEHGKSLTKWLKRVRKNSNSKLRYLLVAEWHSQNDIGWHYHCLLHEQFDGQPLLHRHLDNWGRGFVKFNLIEDGQSKEVNYVCKYLAKDMDVPVRASIRYGEVHSPETAFAIVQMNS